MQKSQPKLAQARKRDVLESLWADLASDTVWLRLRWSHQDPDLGSAPPVMAPFSGSHCSPLLSCQQLQTHIITPNPVSPSRFFHKPHSLAWTGSHAHPCDQKMEFTYWFMPMSSIPPPEASKCTGLKMREGKFFQSKSGSTQSLWLLSSRIEMNQLCCCRHHSETEH